MTSAIVNFVILPQGESAPPQATVSDFTSVMPVTAIKTVGAMMHTTVSGWERLDKPQRVRKIEELGQIAQNKGFKMMYVVDQVGRHVADWTFDKGVKLDETQLAGTE